MSQATCEPQSKIKNQAYTMFKNIRKTPLLLITIFAISVPITTCLNPNSKNVCNTTDLIFDSTK